MHFLEFPCTFPVMMFCKEIGSYRIVDIMSTYEQKIIWRKLRCPGDVPFDKVPTPRIYGTIS